MTKLVYILSFCILPILTFGENGVDGCLIVTGITMQQRLYHIPYTEGAGSPTEWIATGNTAGYNVVTPKKCFQESGPPCSVYKPGTTGANPPPTEVIYYGTYAIVIPCPIDDYVPLVLLGSAGIGVFILKKREFGIFD